MKWFKRRLLFLFLFLNVTALGSDCSLTLLCQSFKIWMKTIYDGERPRTHVELEVTRMLMKTLGLFVQGVEYSVRLRGIRRRIGVGFIPLFEMSKAPSSSSSQYPLEHTTNDRNPNATSSASSSSKLRWSPSLYHSTVSTESGRFEIGLLVLRRAFDRAHAQDTSDSQWSVTLSLALALR